MSVSSDIAFTHTHTHTNNNNNNTDRHRHRNIRMCTEALTLHSPLKSDISGVVFARRGFLVAVCSIENFCMRSPKALLLPITLAGGQLPESTEKD